MVTFIGGLPRIQSCSGVAALGKTTPTPHGFPRLEMRTYAVGVFF
jgi:hypothetical protein